MRRIVGRYGAAQLQAQLPQGTTIEAAYWAGLKHIEETLNLKAYADYRPVGSVPPNHVRHGYMELQLQGLAEPLA